jgi:membrane protein
MKRRPAGLDRRVRGAARFLAFLLRRFGEDRGLPIAAELSYITLLALAPTFAVVFPFAAAFPVFRDTGQRIEDFIFANFLPATGAVLQEYLDQLAVRAATLTVPGLLFLLATVLIAMATIERSFNDIWRVENRRGVFPRLVVYWAVITLGPLLVGAGLLMTSYLASLPLLRPGGDAFVSLLLAWLPALLSFLAFTLLYAVVPNRRVPLRHALIGAASAALLFEAAKAAFTGYVSRFTSYESFYGALSVLPVFLTWLYVSWVIVILGAELTCCLTTYRAHAATSGARHSDFAVALRLVARLREGLRAGDTLGLREWSRLEEAVHFERLQSVLDRLETARIVHHTSDGRIALSRSTTDLTLTRLQRALGGALPEPFDEPELGGAPLLADALARAQRAMEGALDIPVERLIEAGGPGARSRERRRRRRWGTG